MRFVSLGSVLVALALVACEAPPVAAPTDLTAEPDPEGVVVSWKRSADDGGGSGVVRGYHVLRGSSRRGPFLPFAYAAVDKVPDGRVAVRDTSGPPGTGEVVYQVWAMPERESASPSHAGGSATSALVAMRVETHAPAATAPERPRPPGRVAAAAPAHDDGTHLVVRFRVSPDDRPNTKVPMRGYVVLRGRSASGPFQPFSGNEAPAGAAAAPDDPAARAARVRLLFDLLGRGASLTEGDRQELRVQVLAALPADRRVRARHTFTDTDRLAPLLDGTRYEGQAEALRAVLAGEEAPAGARALEARILETLAGATPPEPGAERRRAVTDAVADGGPFYYQVFAVPERGDAVAATTVGPVSPDAALFGAGKAGMGVLLASTFLLTLFFVDRARTKGEQMYIRRIAGVDALEEAIGRATEMGRPVLYVPGIDEIQNIQTIASLLILGRVSELVARYDAQIKVPCCIPLVATVAEEVVRQGFYNAGRPDAHRPQNIQWISSEQFAFCAGTNGIMLREKPATNIFLGRFFAESLILAETGHVNRAIQIAGTAEITQLPFFIAACDYTLIGEELFAVSAYMTREPRLLGTLKAADWVKVGVLTVVLSMGAAAVLVWAMAPMAGGNVFASACLEVLSFLAPGT